MNILHVAYSCVPDKFYGGVAKVVFSLARYQAAQGHQVTVYATNYNSQYKVDVPLTQPVNANGVCIYYYQALDSRWFRSPHMRHAIRKNAENFDVIHSHNTFLALNRYAAEAAQATGAKLFYHIHGALDPVVVHKGLWKQLRKRLYISLIERRNYETANGLFALSDAEAQQINDYNFGTLINVVSNGVLLLKPLKDKGVAFRQEWQINEEQIVILFIGRIVPKKGLHILLAALAHICRQTAKVVLVIAGNRHQASAYTEQLDNFVHENKLENAVRWTGFLDEMQKEAAYAAADLFSHATESEGMAMSILEAMGAGLPVIVSRECYMDKAVQVGAVLETEYNTVCLTQALEELINYPEKRKQMGAAAQKFVSQHHSWSVIAEKIVSEYQKIL